MSPRRRLETESDRDEPVGDTQTTPRDWRGLLRRVFGGLPALAVAAALLVVAAVAATGWMLWQHDTDRRANAVDADVLGYVGQFMTEYTTLDPFHANDYADRVLNHATGEFAKEYKEKQNSILILVAQAEPTTGAVLDAGIEKWHDDGSVSVLVATKMTNKGGDPKKPVVSGNKWVVTAVKEGQQWKISKLIPVT
ncbi:MAG: Mce-associated rane protein [Mycobacterium sp.]|jgi:Mce-associated membrane protein|nr:Mce-associated rane protein [Mycobacterium sp.]